MIRRRGLFTEPTWAIRSSVVQCMTWDTAVIFLSDFFTKASMAVTSKRKWYVYNCNFYLTVMANLSVNLDVVHCNFEYILHA